MGRRDDVRTYLESDDDAKEKESEVDCEELEQFYIELIGTKRNWTKDVRR